MNVTREPYEGSTEEENGYYQSPGAIYSFSENNKIYRFNIEDSIPAYASAVTALINGEEVALMVHEPFGDNKKVQKIPIQCAVFQKTLNELTTMGVKYLSLYNQQTGGFTQFTIAELDEAQPVVPGDAPKAARPSI